MRGLTVVFDLDGTLIETAPDLLHAANHALNRIGVAPVAMAQIRPFISLGARAMIIEGLRLGGHVLSAAEIDELWGYFVAYYADNIAVESHAYPGLENALTGLSQAGATLAVCTNKQERLSRQLLDTLGLGARFAALAGRDTFAVCKPHPDHLLGTIRLAGGDRHRAIMIGDSDTDIKTARAAGIPVIAVPFGYTDIPVQDLAPDRIVDHYDDLEAAIRALLPR